MPLRSYVMGPIVDPVAVQARPRWLALLVLASTSLLAFAVLRRPAPPPAPAIAAGASRDEPGLDLDRLARAHRAWIADHGPGCARTPAHFAGYVMTDVPAELRDPWGSPLDFRCTRDTVEARPTVVVELRSAGPDRERGTPDDLVGRDVHALALIDL